MAGTTFAPGYRLAASSACCNFCKVPSYAPARPHLYLRRQRSDKTGSHEAVWIIKDRGHQRSTGCAAHNVEGAERAFAKYLASKHARAARQARNRDPDEIPVADVLTLYLTDIVPKHSRPNETQGRLAALGDAAPSGHRRNPQPDPASNPDACIISD